MFCALNTTLRRQRRRLVMLAVMLGLAGAVVTAHSAIQHNHMGDAIVMCLAVAETAVVAAGAALAVGALLARPRWLLPAAPLRRLAFVPAQVVVDARAGPPRLQVFRL